MKQQVTKFTGESIYANTSIKEFITFLQNLYESFPTAYGVVDNFDDQINFYYTRNENDVEYKERLQKEETEKQKAIEQINFLKNKYGL